MESPYKKLRSANQKWIGYINLSKLQKNLPYKILGISETNHAVYGKGQQATILAPDGLKWRVQIPGKYLSKLSTSDLDIISNDISKGHNPYIVYRDQMGDKSYRMDIIEKSQANDALFSKGKIVPEFEDVEDIDPSDVSTASNADNSASNADNSPSNVDNSASNADNSASNTDKLT